MSWPHASYRLLARVADNPQMFDRVRRARRTARVVRTAARLYFGYRRTQRKVRNRTQAEADLAWAARHEQFAEELYRLATGLKGLYIKTGQFVGTRSDIFPEVYTRSLSRLQDRVPPQPVARVRRTIEESLGRPVDQLFGEFDDEPLATASLAQVHRARLYDGREVAVKVQHPEVAGLVRLDVRNLRTLVGIVARRQPNFDYRAIVNEIGTQVPLELDFIREAAMTKRVAANLVTMPAVVIPAVIDEMVSERVMVAEFLVGARLFGEEHRADVSVDGPGLAGTITAAYGQMLLVDGLFQADPHPGNILVLGDGRVGLLDFGLTKELPAIMRLGFARLVCASAARDVKGILAAFKELGVRTKDDDPEGVLGLMSLLFEPRQAGPSAFEGARRQALKRNPVEAIPGDLVLLGRVIGLLRGVCASLGSPLSPMQMLRPYAEQALAEGAAEGAAAS